MIERIAALLDRALSFVENIFVSLCGASLILMMLWITGDATGRYFFHYPIRGTYEFSEEYLMVILIFLSLSYTYVQGGHVRITVFLRFIPKAIQRWLSVISDLLGLIFFVLIVIASWDVAVRALEMRVVSNNILQYPLAPSFFMVPLGSGLLSLRIFQSLIEKISITRDLGHEQESFLDG